MLESFVFGNSDNDKTSTSSSSQRKTDEYEYEYEYQRLGHYDVGNELLSLQSLWEYCRRDTNSSSSSSSSSSNHFTDDNENDNDNGNDAVVYLHSKGAYSNTIENTKLRFFLTAGALSDDCTNGIATTSSSPQQQQPPQKQPPRCNVCSSRFSPLPHPHTSGNMWTASCDYIQKLFEPSKFQQRMRRFHPPKSSPACIGRQRWSAEHWVHTHPTVQPCDLYTPNDFLFNYEHLPNVTSVDEVREKLMLLLTTKTTTNTNTNTNTTDTNTNTKTTKMKLMELQEAPRFDLETFSSTGICKNTGVGTLEMRLKEHAVLYNYTATSGTYGKQYSNNKTVPQSWWGWKFWNTSNK